MKIIAFSDIHSSLHFLNRQVADDLQDADLAVISGDITNFGNAAQAQAVISQLKRYNKDIYAVPGNCDPQDVDQYLRSIGANLNCNCVEFGSVALIGVGGTLACQRHRAGESREDDIAVCLDHAVERVKDSSHVIFVSHYPPINTRVDDVGGGHHGGSTAIRSYIESFQPMLSITGHIHDAVGTDTIGTSTLVNPGSFREGSYAAIEISDKIDSVDIKQL